MRNLILFIACGLAATTHAADERFSKPINLPDFDGEELVAVPLDSDIYAASGPDFPDLRIVTADKKEMAYVVRRAQAKRSRTERQVWDATDLKLKPLDDGGLEITFRSNLERHPQPPQGIAFHSPLTNFEHHVKIEASTDGENWQTLVEDGLIFDYSQFMDVRNLALDLKVPENEKPSHYRVTIADVTQEQESQLLELSRNMQAGAETDRTERTVINRQPFRIDRIELWHDKVVRDVSVDAEDDYPLELFKIVTDDKSKQTYIYLTSQREPLTEITLETPNRNFSRMANVYIPSSIPGQPNSWSQLMKVNLERIDFRTLKRESLTFPFREIRSDEYRIVIENRDSPPLEITGAKARGHVYQAVFLADASGKYEINYGGDLRSANYDTAVLNNTMKSGFEPVMATLGPQLVTEMLPEPAKTFMERILNDTWLLSLLIGMLVLILAFGLYRATQNLDQMGEPPAQR
jgi:hypothetical protein